MVHITTRLRMSIAPLILLALFFGIVAPGRASADVNNFTINSFESTAVLSKADPQGQLAIKEDIKLTYTDFNHGILRAIPNKYKNHALQLHVVSISSPTGAPTSFTTYTSNGNTVLKIGDANRTVTGQQEYLISYTLNNVISFYNDHDELYWDVNGDQWAQPFESVKATLTLPNGVTMSKEPVCYTGAYGSTEHNCSVTNSGSSVLFETTQPLGPNQTLSYVAAFPSGTFTPSSWLDTASEYFVTAAKFLIPFLLTAGVAGVWWFIRGRDAKGRGVIVPQYDAPQGMKAIEVGTVYDFDVQNKDITATIIDLAIRGYIKIHETKIDKTLQRDTIEYSLELCNIDVSGLNSNEQTILTGLFTIFNVDSTADLKTLKNKMYTTASVVSDAAEKDLTAQGYFRSNPKKAGAVISGFTGVGVVILFFAFGVLGLPAALGLGLGVVVAMLFARAMPARTPKGVEALEHIKGLKMYMEVAEKDRIQKMQSPNAPYASPSVEPTKTVELFEKLLPFAIVLGVENQWGKQFESLYTTPPDWYVGNWTAFNALYLSQSLNQGFGSAVNSAFTTPSSSSSSGFGGGGFSGGGGGGGGGGGW